MCCPLISLKMMKPFSDYWLWKLYLQASWWDEKRPAYVSELVFAADFTVVNKVALNMHREHFNIWHLPT